MSIAPYFYPNQSNFSFIRNNTDSSQQGSKGEGLDYTAKIKLNNIYPQSIDEFDKIINVLKAFFIYLDPEETDEGKSFTVDPNIPNWLKSYSCSLIRWNKKIKDLVYTDDYLLVDPAQHNFLIFVARKICELEKLTTEEKQIEMDNSLPSPKNCH